MNPSTSLLLSASLLWLSTTGADASGSYNPQLRRRNSTAAAAPAPQPTKVLLNVDQNGLALQGFDPVAFFDGASPAKGSPEFKTTYQGAIYYFATGANLAAFRARPERYLPQYGGFSVSGVARGVLLKVDVNTFQLIAGRLVLHHSQAGKRSFDRDPLGNIERAQAMWPGLVESKGQEVSR